MKTLHKLGIIVLLPLILSAQPSPAQAQTSAFTYQGRLDDGGSPANGSYDLSFALFDAASGGTQQGGSLTNAATAVSNGLFTISLDFGNQFPGAERWLEIAVRTNGGGAFATLALRQPITATPYAIRAIKAASVDEGTVNNPSFIGTTTAAPLEFFVNSQRAFQLQYPTVGTIPNLLGGSSSNSIGSGTEGAVLSGGGSAFWPNTIGTDSDFSSIGGGRGNNIQADTWHSMIGGGYSNSIGFNADLATISGGSVNSIGSNAFYTTIAGGLWNDIAPGSSSASIGGGQDNNVGANASAATIAGGFINTIASNSQFAVIAGGYYNDIGAGSSYGGIGGGNDNNIAAATTYGTIAGGSLNNLGENAFASFIGGGSQNQIGAASSSATVGGGSVNIVNSNSPYGTIAGGQQNVIHSGAAHATISGGYENNVINIFATVGGGRANHASGISALVAGGWYNTASGGQATVAGGEQNTASGYAATVTGGNHNTASSDYAIAGGSYNTASGQAATVAGGSQNTASAIGATVSGGGSNQATNNYAAIGGGYGNQAWGTHAIVPGGLFNQAAGASSFAAGRRAKALHNGAFNWADAQDADFYSTTSNQFNVRAAGGVRLITSGAGLTVDGQPVLAGVNGGSLTNLNASQLSGGTVPEAVLNNAWKIGGNTGTTPGTHFLGTTDNAPLEFKVNGQRALRLEYASNFFGVSMNVIGGFPGNSVGSGLVGAVIAGGGNFGNSHYVGGNYATVVGGLANTASGLASTAMGTGTIASGTQSTAMGRQTTASGDYSTAMGYRAKANHQGTFVWADSFNADFASSADNQFLIRATGGVGINTTNPQGNLHIYSANNPAVVRVQSSAQPGFGRLEFVSNPQGDANEWRPGYIQSTDAGDFTGGLAFHVNGSGSGSKFGSSEVMRVQNGRVGIGTTSPQSPLHVQGTARVNGADQWDVNNTEGDFRVGSDTHRFKIGVAQGGGGAGDVWMRAQGGTARLFLKTPGGTTIYSNEGQTSGVSLASGSTAWAVVSDRNMKKDFAAIDAVEVLEKLAALPITQWRYQWENADTTPHIGPMAQDFKAAFYPGTDEKSITTLEADGVAMAAIQGLNQKLEAKNAEIESLKQSVAELKQLVQTLVEKK